MELKGLSIEEEAEQTQELRAEALAQGDEALEQVEPVAEEAKLRSLKCFFSRMGCCSWAQSPACKAQVLVKASRPSKFSKRSGLVRWVSSRWKP